MMTLSPTKAGLQELLERADYSGILEMAGRRPTIVRSLISMTYDKADPISWRAMEAIGRVAATWDPEKGRNLIQRLLWMMREESGTNPWSAGEIISEILRQKVEPYLDIAPIVISFHDEPILRIGALWCIHRLGAAKPDLVEQFAHVAIEYLGSENPTERGHSLLALITLGADKYREHIEKLTSDTGRFSFYNGENLEEAEIGELAKRALG